MIPIWLAALFVLGSFISGWSVCYFVYFGSKNRD